jgi:hypothetical protein
MPWSAITSLAEGNGFWAFLGAVFTAACFAAVGLWKTVTFRGVSRDTDLSERENRLFAHLSGEVDRLNTVVFDLDAMMKSQTEEHRQAMLAEREKGNARMTAMQAEIELLKRRMSSEESR